MNVHLRMGEMDFDKYSIAAKASNIKELHGKC
jgi:hypothetical protein